MTRQRQRAGGRGGRGGPRGRGRGRGAGRGGPRQGGPRGRGGRSGRRGAEPRPSKPSKRAAPKPQPKAVREPPPEEVFAPVEPDLELEDGVFRAGYVALVGRPNVGKSTLLNALLGQKIAATTHKPQTTRKNLLGVLNPGGAQVLMLDTPGYHQAKGPLNRYMVAQAEHAIADADVVGFVTEARGDAKITPGNERLLKVLAEANKPVVLILNKVDRVKNKEGLLTQIQAFHAALGDNVVAVVPISATRRNGLERVVLELGRALPPGTRFFEDDTLTDQSERSIVAELIREKVILATQDELPYAAAVTIDAFEDERPRLVRIIATIHVERSSQKPIVIGKQGSQIKGIGIRARHEIQRFVGSKVFLELHVRVTGGWSNSRRAMADLGYTEDREVAVVLEPSDEEGDDVPEDVAADVQAFLQEEDA